MDHELKQRLIGAVVVTALAAIFIPMLFDDPVDTSGKVVTELTIPQAPTDAATESAQAVPENKAQVLNRPDIELDATEVNEDSQANTTGEAPIATILDGEQSVQTGMPEAATGSSADNAENAPVDSSAHKQPVQNEVPGLDTGEVQGTIQPEDSQVGIVTKTETAKKPEQALDAPAKKPATKPIVSQKAKTKAVSSTEKTKPADKIAKDTTKKSSSKLVRYSIQAGSFSKKENAQTLVEKLRKQGMPATLATKGNLFRVKIGPALDKNKAKEMKAKLDKQNIKGLLVSE